MEIHEKAEKDYIQGMKYKDIAEKYNVSVNTVKSWKTRHDWVRNKKESSKKVCTQKKKKVCTQNAEHITEEETPEEEADGLTDKMRLFCAFYLKYFNATKAYQKAYECDYASAAVGASRLLRKAKINEYIQGMKEDLRQKMLMEQEDLIQKYIDVVNADINDFMVITEEGVCGVRPEMDGTLVQSIKNTKYGVEVRMPDKLRAMDRLKKIFEEQKQEEESAEEGGCIIIAAREELENDEEKESDLDSATETD